MSDNITFISDAERELYFRFKRPSVAATVAVLDGEDKVLVIKRHNTAAFNGYWCLPGGFIETDEETIEECAVRELFEETGILLEKERLSFLAISSKPNLDPRMHVINVTYVVKLFGETRAVSLQESETNDYKWVDPFMFGQDKEEKIAFDHRDLILRLTDRTKSF